MNLFMESSKYCTTRYSTMRRSAIRTIKKNIRPMFPRPSQCTKYMDSVQYRYSHQQRRKETEEPFQPPNGTQNSRRIVPLFWIVWVRHTGYVQNEDGVVGDQTIRG